MELVITIVALLITPLVPTHEPPSTPSGLQALTSPGYDTVQKAFVGMCSCMWVVL